MQIDSIASPFANQSQSILRSEQGAALSIPGSDMGPDSASGPKSFGEFLQNAISEVNDAQNKAGDLQSAYAAGAPVDIHQVMIASQEADVSLQLAMNVRNKLTDGFNELMKVSM